MRAWRVSAGVLVSLFALSACGQVPSAPPVDPRAGGGEPLSPLVSGEPAGVDGDMSVLFLGDVVRGIGRAAGSVVETVGDVAGGVVGSAEDVVGGAGRVVGGLISDVAESASNVAETVARPVVEAGSRAIQGIGRYLDRRAASAVQQPKPVRRIGKRLPSRGDEVGLNPQPLPPRDRQYLRDRYLRDRSPDYYPDQRRYDRPAIYRPQRPIRRGYDRDYDRYDRRYDYDRRYEGQGRYDRGYGDYVRDYDRDSRYNRRYEPQGRHWGNYQPYYQDQETWSPPRRQVMQDDVY